MIPLSPEAIEQHLDVASEICARQDAQLTPLRRSVLGLVLQAERPITAYQLLDKLKETRERAMPPTVYRALDFLIENHIIHKIEQINAFVPCMDPGHAHAVQFLICRKCGTVNELENHMVSHAVDQAARAQGFHPSRVVIEIDGICAECKDLPAKISG
jgi:Fur family zinc uptake transcriptional regulator